MMRCPFEWEIYRRPSPFGRRDMGDAMNGCLVIPSRGLRIVFSVGEGWEHVSISLNDRTPTWDEMELVKRKFWQPEATVMQLHVPVAEHKNCHPYCLHLWRPMVGEIPRPPSIFVSP